MDLSPEVLEAAVETGVLVCPACKLWYPIERGLPILLPYTTRLHRDFAEREAETLRALGPAYHPPDEDPAPGEGFVRASFSDEWLDYSYDGVLWTWSYADREALFLAEMGEDSVPAFPTRFVEIGCGLGLVTSFAAKHFPGDAVGVDLSLAALRASRHFSDNPFLHFVQASLWQLPFERESFDRVYSHGVLHHTFSTEKAFRSIAGLCAPQGRMYVWLYGMDSIQESAARRAAYGVEWALRPMLARLPSGAAGAILAPAAVAYMGINRAQRFLGSPRESYTFRRALHAARDRLTPLYAHRTREEDLRGWFNDCQFENLQILQASEVPSSTRETIRRNLGMRGRRSAGSPAPANAQEKE